MESIQKILSKRKYNNIPCPRCSEDQGYFQLRGRSNHFVCTACGYDCYAKNYNYLRKEYHKAHEDNLDIVEIDTDNI